MKRKKKSLTITLFDEETSSNSESESYVRALISFEIEEVLEKVGDDELHALTATDTNLLSGSLEECIDHEPKVSP